jgi:hypothetical protein
MKTTLFLLLLLVPQLSFTQEIKTKFIQKIPLIADQFIGIDELENLYYIKGNTFYKKTKNETLSYANVALGNIESIDIQNPFKILVFYKDFNSVVFLDNKLNELSTRIDFTQETLFHNVLFVSHSSENNIWLFADDNKLHLYDFQNRFEKLQTQPITFYQPNFNCSQLISSYQDAFVVGNLGIIQFNQYGNFIHFFNLENVSSVHIYKEGFTYVKDGAMFYQDKEKNLPIQVNLEGSITNIKINNGFLTIYDGLAVYIYQLF